MAEPDYSKWTNPDGGEEGSADPQREQFLTTKSETEWTEAAQGAGMSVEEYLNQEYATHQQAQGDDGGGQSPEEIEAARLAAEQAASGGAGDEGGAGGGEEFTPNPLWKELEGIEGFTMPEGLTAETEVEILKKALVDNGLAEAGAGGDGGEGGAGGKEEPAAATTGDPEIDAFMKYKQINPEATMADYMAQRTQYSDMLNLDDREFMVAHLKQEYGIYDAEKNPDGLTEDQIDETIEGMESNKTLLLEAKKLKRGYREQASKVTDVSDADVEAHRIAEREKNNEVIRADAKKLFAETEKITELNGVKVSKAELTEINSAFEKAVLPDEQGNVPMMEMLQSDRVLWNFFATNYLGDSKFKTALFNAGDATKDELMGKLGLKAVNTGGRQTDTGKKNVITPANWSQPDPND